jgi:ATPase family associated with various cellular activities (AAA)
MDAIHIVRLAIAALCSAHESIQIALLEDSSAAIELVRENLIRSRAFVDIMKGSNVPASCSGIASNDIFSAASDSIAIIMQDLHGLSVLDRPLHRSAGAGARDLIATSPRTIPAESVFPLSNLLLPTQIIKFSDVVGNAAAKQSLYESVILPFSLTSPSTPNITGDSRAQIFSGIRSRMGNVLLFGPPGCGKTLLVQASAAESGAELFSVRPSDILSKYQGEPTQKETPSDS